MPSTSVSQAIHHSTTSYIHQSHSLLKSHSILSLLSPLRLWTFLWSISYICVQAVIIWAFKPKPPPDAKELTNPRGRIAVIGAGITGVSSAAHAISHGFEVTLFESASSDKLGGIWANVNSTSGLQLNSLLYRFHPAVMWQKGFPLRDEILEEVRRIWTEYHLDTRTRFNTKVTSVKRAPAPKDDSSWAKDPTRSRWIINDNQEEIFDAVIVTIGTCGDPNWVKIPGMPENVDEQHAKKDSSAPPTQDHDSTSSSSSSESASAHTADEEEQKDTEEEDKHNHDGHHSAHNDDGESKNDKETFTKPIIHSSQLDSFTLDSPSPSSGGSKKKVKIVVIGSGASGVEAVETVLEKFGGDTTSSNGGEKKGADVEVEVYMVSRDNKWIIPRNIVVDTLISGQPFGREMPLSFLWEAFLRRWQYHGVEELVPQDRGIYEGTPVVNDVFLSHVRTGRCTYIRSQPVRLNKDGVVVTGRKKQPGLKRNSTKRDNSNKKTNGYGGAVDEIHEGEERVYEADVVVLATGFKKPSLDFLPQDLFPEGYQRPDLYLQNFSTEDWSILMTNSAYMNAIGTVGHFHIGIYTRILLTLLMDPAARPEPRDMKLWVDVLRFIKRGATGGALGFFTYMELTIWLIGFHLFRPDRMRWMFFIMNGWGVHVKE